MHDCDGGVGQTPSTVQLTYESFVRRINNRHVIFGLHIAKWLTFAYGHLI